MEIFRYLGRAAIERMSAFAAAWEIAVFSTVSFLLSLRQGRRAAGRVLLKQIYFTGFEALPMISWTALILGLVIVTQSLSILPGLGGESLLGEILVWVVVREIGPIFASVLVIARSGTAIASELGSMRISGQFTALEVMGIDPMRYLIAPRVLGVTLSVLVLTFYFEAVSLLGGFLLAGFGKAISFSAYTGSILEAMGFIEVVASLLKSVFFGLIIGSVCSHHGLMAEKSMTQIPQQTTKAVMGSLTLIFMADALITFLFYM